MSGAGGPISELNGSPRASSGPRHLAPGIRSRRATLKCPMKINAYLAKSSVVAALGGLLFGFDTAVISGATGALRSTYALTDWSLGLTVAAALYGTILGSMFGGIPGDRYGRRASLRITAVLYLISALGCAFA